MTLPKQAIRAKISKEDMDSPSIAQSKKYVQNGAILKMIWKITSGISDTPKVKQENPIVPITLLNAKVFRCDCSTAKL